MAYKNKADAIRYNNTYIKQTYDRINLTLPKGTKDMIKAVADRYGDTVNYYLLCLISHALWEEVYNPGSGFHKVDLRGKLPEPSALYNALASNLVLISDDPPENDPSDSDTL